MTSLFSRLDLPAPSKADVLAGASVALVLIPQSLAYAELAGLPPFVGLFASSVPLLVFSLFASSPYLQTGPTAVVSLLTFAALPGDVDPSALPGLAALLALLVGGFRFVFGLLRAGVVVRCIALPVITGFTSGAAVLIIASQLPRSLGVADRDGGVIADALRAVLDVGQWDQQAVLLSVVTLTLFLGGRRLHPLFPGVLVAVIVGIIWSQVGSYGGETVASVPEGLPPFGLDLPWNEAPGLVVAAAVIALIGFAEPVSIARTFANEEGQTWDPNREFMASGLANAMSAIVGGYPVGGSFSRSSVNKLAGATSRWAGGITGLVVVLFLPFASVLQPLPRAVLSAIVVGAASSLVRPRRLLALSNRDGAQAALAWVVFVTTLVVAPRVELAIALGVVASLALHVIKGLQIEVTDYGAGLAIAPRGLFWLGTDAHFASQVEVVTEQLEPGQSLTFDFSATPFLDDPAIQAMRRADETLRRTGGAVQWVNPPEGTERMLGCLDRE